MIIPRVKHFQSMYHRILTFVFLFVCLLTPTYAAHSGIAPLDILHDPGNFWRGVYLGAILIIVCYNLFLYLSLKDRSYLWYIVFESAILLQIVSRDLYANNYTALPYLRISYLSMSFALISMSFFAREFLQTRTNAKRGNNALWLIPAFSLLLMLPTFFKIFPVIIFLYWLLAIVATIICIWCGINCMERGFRPARFFLLSLTILLLGGLISGLSHYSDFYQPHFGHYAFQIAAVVEALLLALALADRIKILEWFRSVTDISPDSIIVHSEDGVLFMNQTARELANLKPNQNLDGVQILDLIAHQDRDRFQEMIRRFDYGSQELGKVEIHAKADRQTSITLEAASAPIVYLGQESILTVGRDITERKLAEVERENLIKELQDALVRIKTLQGLLPICAGCKKIRDDSGYWNQLESYISTHSEAEFTHSLCPPCASKLYPEIYGEGKRDPNMIGGEKEKTQPPST